MIRPPAAVGTRWSLILLFTMAAALLGFVVALNPHDRSSAAIQRAAEAPVSGLQAVADAAGISGNSKESMPPAAIPTGPRAARVMMLYVGPSERYARIGQIGKGARLEVVGRDESGAWLAVSLNPGSELYGWTLAPSVENPPDIAGLPVLPVQLLNR